MKKTLKKTSKIFLIVLCITILFITIAGCSETANKLESIENNIQTERYISSDNSMGDTGMHESMMIGAPTEPKGMMMNQRGMEYESYEVEDEIMIAPVPPYEDSYGEVIDIEQKIIKSASITLEVKDYFLASEKAEAYAKKYDGYVSNSNAYKDYNGKTKGTTTIRIPEMHYDAIMAELSLLGTVENKNVDGQDVTEQYMDITSRLNNAKAHEKRLVQMYENTSNVKEMMSVEREVSRVRGEIERYQGQLRYMNNKIDYSTITVTFHEKQPVVKEWGIIYSFKQAIRNMLATIRILILLTGWVLPLILIVGIVVGSIKFAKRKKRKTIK